MDRLCGVHDTYRAKAFSCAKPETCPMAEIIAKIPKNKKRKSKPVRANPTEPGVAEGEPISSEPEPESSPVVQAKE